MIVLHGWKVRGSQKWLPFILKEHKAGIGKEEKRKNMQPVALTRCSNLRCTEWAEEDNKDFAFYSSNKSFASNTHLHAFTEIKPMQSKNPERYLETQSTETNDGLFSESKNWQSDLSPPIPALMWNPYFAQWVNSKKKTKAEYKEQLPLIPSIQILLTDILIKDKSETSLRQLAGWVCQCHGIMLRCAEPVVKETGGWRV